MGLQPGEHRSSIATLRVVTDQLIEIHYDAGIVFSVKAVAEVQEKRRELMRAGAYATLTIIPEDVDYQLETMTRDQSLPDRPVNRVLASAVVAKASMIQLLTKLYFSYFPQLQRIFVTDDEDAARAWLLQQLKEIAEGDGGPIAPRRQAG